MRPIQSTLMLAVTFITVYTGDAPGADRPANVRVAIPMKVQRYARSLIDEYDVDCNGELAPTEWEQMGGAPKLADRDRNGVVTASELADHIARYGRRRKILLMPGLLEESGGFPSLLRSEEKSPKDKAARLEAGMGGQAAIVGPRSEDATAGSKTKTKVPTRRFVPSPSRMPTGLPSWFRSLDRNGDAQLTLAEFSPEGVPAAIEEYTLYDLNRDGLLTPDEYIRSTTRPSVRRPVDKTEVLSEADNELGVDEFEELEPSETAEKADGGAEKAVPTATKRKVMSAKEKAELKKLQRTSRPSKKS